MILQENEKQCKTQYKSSLVKLFFGCPEAVIYTARAVWITVLSGRFAYSGRLAPKWMNVSVKSGPNQSNLNFIWPSDVGIMGKKAKGKAREDTNVPALSEK